MVIDIEGFNLAFIHLLAVIATLGSSLFLIFFLLPISENTLSSEHYHKLVAKVLRKFHPFLLACYGLLIMTGAWMLTRYKIDAGVNFFSEYGQLLIIKLSLVFLAIMVACYQFFGIGTGIVYMVDEAYDSTNKEDLAKRIRRLRLTALINLGILVIIVYLGLGLTRP